MKKFFVLFAVATLFSIVALPFPPSVQATQNSRACWGQATKVFASMGDLGEHSSQEPTPRLGLRNLARALFEAGILYDDTMQELGRFVSEELGLTIDACLDE